MMDFGLRPKYAEHLIRTIADRTPGFLDKLLETCGDRIDLVYMADDYCSQLGPLFSPQVFRQMVVPYLRAATEKVHAHGKKFLLHCCGAVRPLLPMIIEAGVDLQQVLCQGSPQEVADEVRRLIDILGADGGYILGPGHTYIQVDAPVENILAMYETGRTHHPWNAGQAKRRLR